MMMMMGNILTMVFYHNVPFLIDRNLYHKMIFGFLYFPVFDCNSVTKRFFFLRKKLLLSILISISIFFSFVHHNRLSLYSSACFRLFLFSSQLRALEREKDACLRPVTAMMTKTTKKKNSIKDMEDLYFEYCQQIIICFSLFNFFQSFKNNFFLKNSIHKKCPK